MSSIKNISAVIPVYNEKENVQILSQELRKAFAKHRIKFNIIFIIEGNDGTHEKLKEMQKAGFNELKLYYYGEKRLGVGKAFAEGFRKVPKDSTHVLTLDADMNHHPEELWKFFRCMEETGTDIVIGSRKVKGGELNLSGMQKILSNFTNFLLPKLFSLDAKDITSGYRLFRREVTDSIVNDLKFTHFEIYPEILVRARKRGFRMKEVPIKYRKRTEGKSKMNLFRSGLGYARLLVS